MLTAEQMHLILYFLTEYQSSKQNIIILIANVQLIFGNEAQLNIFWEYMNRKLFAVQRFFHGNAAAPFHKFARRNCIVIVILNPAYLPEARAVCNAADHGLINYIDTKAKCCHLKRLTCKETLRQVFVCLRPPPLLGVCVGWSSNLIGSESGKIQSVNFLQNMVSSRTQHPPPPPSQILSAYFDTGKGGGRVEPKRRPEGQQ